MTPFGLSQGGDASGAVAIIAAFPAKRAKPTAKGAYDL
jgi:hypothetical protein